VKYMLLAYTPRDAWDTMDVTSEEFQAACAVYVDLSQELAASGELVSTEGLGHPSLSRTIRPSADGPLVSDGTIRRSQRGPGQLLDHRRHRPRPRPGDRRPRRGRGR